MPAHKRLNNKKSRKDLAVDFDYHVNGDSQISSPESPMSPPNIESEGMKSPPSNGRSILEFTQDEKITNLTKLNNTLVREVASLRFDKDSLTSRVKELEEQLLDNSIDKSALARENQELLTMKENMVAKCCALEHDKLVLSEENVSLCKQKVALLEEKERLEMALLEARQNLEESLEQMEQSKLLPKLRIDAMDTEICKLLSDGKMLSQENESLKLLIGDREREVEKLMAELLLMKQEHQSLVNKIEKAEESADIAKKSMDALRHTGIMLEGDKVMLEFEKEKFQVIDKLKQLKTEVAILEEELDLARSKEDEVLLNLAKEQEINRDLLRELSLSDSSKKALEESLNSTRLSLDKIQESNKRKETQVLSLEECVALLSKEIVDMQKSRHDVELDLQTQITILSKEVSSRQAENSVLKQKISSLEVLLWDMEKEAKSGERTLWELLSELRSVHALFDKKAQVAKYAVPIAAVSSGTLAFVGLLAYLRFRKKHKAVMCF